ncbi:DUF308 domain-containing protein [Actinokineospora auranticolor]|uniref:DUF308 domain-containing protein n=1 Tax=Actinokineospora auranticolor TaxID=155976 RepID=A0A2S6GG15_9PSEU|nr:hypothetical protein [Actinokineospora auranticolor]PPK64178.1 hypothetical protein CLV40_12142 [Actinokineospora auranticolor]
MKSRPGDGPEDVDAAFAQIVADLEREGVGRDLPDDLGEPETPPTGTPALAAPTATWRAHETEIDWADDNENEHYEPPEPPPLPKLRPMTIVALVALVAGVVLLLLPALIGLDARIATPAGLIALAAGIALLLLRTRKTPPTDPDDNGAQV